jgi:hypothetical protein
MEKLLARLAKIKDKIGALKIQNQKLSVDLKKSESTVLRLQKLIAIQNSTIKHQEQQLKLKRIATQLTSDQKLPPNESRELKYKINEIIKEVDKVMATIHQ